MQSVTSITLSMDMSLTLHQHPPTQQRSSLLREGQERRGTKTIFLSYLYLLGDNLKLQQSITNSHDYEKRLKSSHMLFTCILKENSATDTWVFIIIFRKKSPHPSKWKSTALLTAKTITKKNPVCYSEHWIHFNINIGIFSFIVIIFKILAWFKSIISKLNLQIIQGLILPDNATIEDPLKCLWCPSIDFCFFSSLSLFIST